MRELMTAEKLGYEIIEAMTIYIKDEYERLNQNK